MAILLGLALDIVIISDGHWNSCLVSQIVV